MLCAKRGVEASTETLDGGLRSSETLLETSNARAEIQNLLAWGSRGSFEASEKLIFQLVVIGGDTVRELTRLGGEMMVNTQDSIQDARVVGMLNLVAGELRK